MAGQDFRYPNAASVTVAAIGPNGLPIPTQSILIAGENPSGNLEPLQVDTNNALIVSPLTSASVVTSNQGAANTLANAWPMKLTDGTNVNTFTANGLKVDGSAVTQPISAASLPLPTGAATNATLLTISGQLPASLGQKASAASLAVVIASDQSTLPVSIAASIPLPTGAATSANQTNGSQKTQIVDGSGNVISSTTNWLNVDVQASALPTGASTSALQTTGNTSLASILTTQTSGTQTSRLTDGTNTAAVKAASTAPVATDPALVVAISPNSSSIPTAVKGTAIGNAPVQNIYSTTNITTGAFVQLVASTTSAINTIHIFDSSGQAMIFAIGGAGSEVAQLYVAPGGDTFTLNVPAGSRISYKALSANATAGYLLMSFLE